MRTIARSLAGTLACLLVAGAALADPSDRCTRDAFVVDGLPVGATVCVPAAGGAQVTVVATYQAAGKTVTHSTVVDQVPGTGAGRAIDDVALSDFGSPKRIHVTLLYRNGEAVIEHALVLPGAIVLK
jgi:hypothetical protein